MGDIILIDDLRHRAIIAETTTMLSRQSRSFPLQKSNFALYEINFALQKSNFAVYKIIFMIHNLDFVRTLL